MTNSSRMVVEAAEAPEVIARQLAANRKALDRLGTTLRDDPPRAIVTCARGSSDHAATYLKHLVETRAGVFVTSASPSVSSIYNAAPAMKDALAIGLSQSGKSPDLLATMNAAKQAGARTLALVNDPDSPLARMADTTLPLHAGAEISVAATKSFIALLAASATLVATWTRDAALYDELDRLPTLLTKAWASDWSAMVERLIDARGLYVIGRGPGFGIAQEAALKLKETCGLHAEAFSAAEVRHGPLALVGPDLPLLVFRQNDESAPGIDALVADALANGARVLVAASSEPPAGADHLFVPAAESVLAPIAAIQSFYRAAETLSRLRGFDPDRPPHLNKVTETV